MAQVRDCLVTQMDAGRRVGDFGTVERHALVLHDLDPLSEDAVRGLMEARAWVGDRSNALKVFGRFEARLAEELGAKPSPDLVRIADLLREGRGAAPRRHGEEAAPEPRERRFEAETLIGREREFSALYDAWLEARRRTPRIIVLTGDPGVGKTTLTNAFLSTCQMEGAVVARAQAYDAERELPFAVLAELVKQLALQRAIGGADPEALAELTRVSPEIPRAFPGVPKPPDWSADVMPLRFADAFLKMVEAAAEESPLVLVVDDIHAADNASAAILHMVARKLPRTRLLLILTGRTNELRTAAAPSALVSDTTVQALQGLELEPLSAEAAERLVTALAVRADATLKPDDLPLYEVVGLSPAAAGEALTRLLEEGFLREVHGGLEFRNELIRAQAYYAIAGPARQHLHREAGSVLAQRKVGDDPRSSNLEVAWHFLRGGDPSSALSSALGAAEAAIAEGAPSEAEQILAALLREPCAQASLQGLRLLLAKALLHQSKAETADAVLDLIARSAESSPRDEAETCRMKAGVEYLLNRELGNRYCEAANNALATARKTGDSELVVKALFE